MKAIGKAGELLFTPGGEGGGGDSAYERGGDVRRLAEGCKFRILVSLRVIVCVLTWFLLGVKKSLGHARISLLSMAVLVGRAGRAK